MACGLSTCSSWAQYLQGMGSLVVACWLGYSVAPGVLVTCIVRQSLNHWTMYVFIMGSPMYVFIMLFLLHLVLVDCTFPLLVEFFFELLTLLRKNPCVDSVNFTNACTCVTMTLIKIQIHNDFAAG